MRKCATVTSPNRLFRCLVVKELDEKFSQLEDSLKSTLEEKARVETELQEMQLSGLIWWHIRKSQ